MSSTGYTPWVVTAGEQPTTAYWNVLGENDASFNTGLGFNDGIIITRHMASGVQVAPVESNPYKFLFTLTNAASTGTGGFFQVPLDTATIDTNGNISTSSHNWTCPITGFYALGAGIGYASAGAGQHAIVTIFKNGVEFVRLYEGSQDDSSNHVFSGAIPMVAVNQGDLLTLEGYSGVNYSLMTNGSAIQYYTWMSGILVSKT